MRVLVNRALRTLPLQARETLRDLSDPARVVSFSRFWELVKCDSELLANRLRVAVVSGGTESELGLLPESSRVDFLNFEQDPHMWDLTNDWSDDAYGDYRSSYDFVLCEQVLEHVSDPALAFRNLVVLLAPGGLLHVSVPGVNGVHGDPFYFYSGFHKRLLKSWAEELELEILDIGDWGSPKAARMYSVCEWTPLAFCGGYEYFLGRVYSLIRSGNWKGLIRSVCRTLKNSFRYPGQDFWSCTGSTPVIVWLLARK